MDRVFVALGSNLGNRLAMLQSALGALERLTGLGVRSVSPVYETEPVGNKNQPQFLNAVIELHSRLSAEDLLLKLKEIERSVGRTPSEKWGPREIDIDLVYYDDLVIDGPALVLPHPEVVRRRFVLTPLADIAPEFVDPVRKRMVRDLLSDCPDESSVSKISAVLNPFLLES
jgi:2-amino-4-hydroxy-6-hydroxymethyldihydropteridine diphosphokinase